MATQARVTTFYEAGITAVIFLSCAVLQKLDITYHKASKYEPDHVDFLKILKTWLSANGFAAADQRDPTLAAIIECFHASPALTYTLHGEGYDEIRILFESDSNVVEVILRLAPIDGVEDVFLRELSENLFVSQQGAAGAKA